MNFAPTPEQQRIARETGGTGRVRGGRKPDAGEYFSGVYCLKRTER